MSNSGPGRWNLYRTLRISTQVRRGFFFLFTVSPWGQHTLHAHIQAGALCTCFTLRARSALWEMSSLLGTRFLAKCARVLIWPDGPIPTNPCSRHFSGQIRPKVPLRKPSRGLHFLFCYVNNRDSNWFLCPFFFLLSLFLLLVLLRSLHAMCTHTHCSSCLLAGPGLETSISATCCFAWRAPSDLGATAATPRRPTHCFSLVKVAAFACSRSFLDVRGWVGQR